MSATLIGTVPKLGIDSDQANILIESIDYDGSTEWYEHKDRMGKKCGAALIDEEMAFSMSGAVPSAGYGAGFKLGASLVLANTPPTMWSTTPTATSTLIKTVKHGAKGGEAQKVDISGTIYPFGNASAASLSVTNNEEEVI